MMFLRKEIDAGESEEKDNIEEGNLNEPGITFSSKRLTNGGRRVKSTDWLMVKEG
jgi:hypothetical protein